MLISSAVLGDVTPPFYPSYDLITLVVIVALVASGVFLVRQKRTRQRGWRVGHESRDSLFYEEFRDGTWQRITIDGEMQFGSGKPYHIIWLHSVRMPEWAHDRQQEIVDRIKSEFREPDYECT